MNALPLRDALRAAFVAGLALGGAACGEGTSPSPAIPPQGTATASAPSASAPRRPSAAATVALPLGCKPERYCRAPRTPPESGGGSGDHAPPPMTYDADGCLPAASVGHVCNGLRAHDGPTFNGKECCYSICRFPVPCGRALLVEGKDGEVVRRVAASREREDWSDEVPVSRSPPGLGLALSQAWLGDAALEHASVAAFARLSLELLAFGAPAALVAGAHRAALDEIEHARLCYGLAAAHAPRPAPEATASRVGPGPLSRAGLRLASTLAELAARTVREACAGETLAALVAARASESCEDPGVARVLARIERDERAHAELAFRAVGWALAQGGDAVRRAVDGAVALALRDLQCVEPPTVEAPSAGRAGRAAVMRAVAEAREALSILAA